MCFDVMISLELWQLRQVLVGFSVASQWQSADFPELPRLEVGVKSWYIDMPPWIKLRVVPLQRGCKVRD